MRKMGLMAGCCLLAFATAAQADDATGQSPAAASQGDERGIQDIIVTAQRRSENLQKSSLAIQVIGGEDLARAAVTNAQDLAEISPGMVVGMGGGHTQIYIRGVGDYSGSGISNPGVSYNVDGVVVGRPEAVNLAVYDIQTVEVLKGPQGTLYGRNATGGNINMITRKPELGVFNGYLTGAVGNFNMLQLNGAINLPLGETAALRVAFDSIRRDGYLSDGTSDEKHDAVRAHLKWEPDDKLSLLASFEYVRVFGKGPGFVPNPHPVGSSKFIGTGDPVAIADLAANYPPFGPAAATIYNTFNPQLNKDAWSASLQIAYDMGWATLKILPAYRWIKYYENVYPGVLDQQHHRSRQFSGEVQLGNESADLKWVTGLYYFNDDTPFDTHVEFGPQGVRTQVPTNTTESYAAFGQATYSIAPKFRVIAGGRYTIDHRAYAGDLISLVPGLPDVVNPFAGKSKFNSFTWKLGLEYDLSPDSMAFFTVGTGFKAGGINGDAAGTPFRPEKVTAYDIGLRNRFLDNRLQVNLGAYYWKYTDTQQGITTLDRNGIPNYLFVNAGKADIYGANIDIVARPSSHDTLKFFAEYNHTKFKDFAVDYFALAVIPGLTTSCPVTPNAANPALATVNCSGRPLTRAPRWVASGSWNHQFDLANGGTVDATFSGNYNSSRWATTAYTPTVLLPSYFTQDVDLTYTAPEKRFTIGAYIHNISNEVVASGAQFGTFTPTLSAWIVGMSRNYGIRATVNF